MASSLSDVDWLGGAVAMASCYMRKFPHFREDFSFAVTWGLRPRLSYDVPLALQTKHRRCERSQPRAEALGFAPTRN